MERDIQASFGISSNRGQWIHKKKKKRGQDSILSRAKQSCSWHLGTIQIQLRPELGSLSLPLPSFLKSSQVLLLYRRLSSELNEERDMAKVAARDSLDWRT